MKPSRRRSALQPSPDIDRAALLLDPPRRRAPRTFERLLQGAIVRFHAEAVINPLQAVLFAVPNGEARDASVGAMLSGRCCHPDLPPETDEEAMRPAGQGLLPGVVDLVLLLPGPHTVLIEVKPPPSRLSRACLVAQSPPSRAWSPKAANYRGGRLSVAQKSFRRAVTAMNQEYHVVETVEQYHALLTAHRVPLRR